jgi:hypothetical protein
MMNHLSQLFRSNLQKGWEKTKPASVSMPTRTIRSVSGYAPERRRYHLLQWTRLMTKPILSLVVSSYRKWYRKMPFPAKIVNFKPHVRKDLISENFQLCKMLFLWKMVKQRELQLLLVTLRLKDFSVLLISNCQSPKGCCCCCCSVQ